MNGEELPVDVNTGIINIEKVTGDIQITVISKKVEIIITTPIINTDENATNSLPENSQTIGTTSYINFTATLEGKTCNIKPEVPFVVQRNRIYKFIVTGRYQNKNITKEIEVKVNQFESAKGMVKYDDGDWTKEEIEEFQSLNLYDINSERQYNSINKIENEEGLNLTFGGFTYKEDKEKQLLIDSGVIITSRNQSVDSDEKNYEVKYDGWQVLETEEKDGKTYVKKIMHAGAPENFAYGYVNKNEGRATYIFSGGKKFIYDKLIRNGVEINPRNRDMYKDKKQLDLINDVNMMTEAEVMSMTLQMRTIGTTYFVVKNREVYGVTKGTHTLVLNYGGYLQSEYNHCRGIRPIVTMKEGVYIVNGTGTEADPYVLGK